MGLLLLITLILGGYARLLRSLAAFLMVEDALQPAAAIIVLSGQVPFREMEAAQLFHAGWAPQIILARGEGSQAEAQQALRAFNLDVPENWELSRAVLLRLGVPPAAIRVTKIWVIGGTREELQAVARELQPPDAPVILVTSKVHTRRTRLTWRYVTGGRSRSIVRAAPRDPFDPTRWWHQRRFILAVTREYLGLINYALGYPVGARDSQPQ